jgi:arginyl-tRNA synthetase
VLPPPLAVDRIERLAARAGRLMAPFPKAFYEKCPVIEAELAQRASRLLLCALIARVLAQGRDL